MKNLHKIVALTLLAALAAAPLVAQQSAASTKLHADMRKLWEDHVTWTRIYIISAAAGLDDQKAAAARLMRNQDDIGNAIRPVYGEAAGTKLTALLKDHIQIATELIAAAKAGDTTKKNDAANRWSKNADDLASFLSGANPQQWPLADMKKMLHDHLNLTTDEVVARLSKDWNGDVAAYDKVHDEILKMADAFSDGIVAQHPEKFA
jgi:hypothetical protein